MADTTNGESKDPTRKSEVVTESEDGVSMPPMDLVPMNKAQITGMHPLGIARVIINQFSCTDRQRAPPSPGKTSHLMLVSIQMSPFCEAARWALDLIEKEEDNEYYYTENCHPAPFHAYQTIPLTNDTHCATPLLVFPDGSFLGQSYDIVDKIMPSLYPAEIAEDIKKFEVEIGNRLGTTMRCVLYSFLLDEEKKYYSTYAKVGCRGASHIETVLYEKMLDKGIDKALKSALKWDPETVQNSIQEVHIVLKEVSERLEKNGGEYIFDTPEKKYGFTAADLTFAAAAYHLMMPPEMSDFVVSEEVGPPQEWLDFMASCQNTTASKHCLKMYQKHRPVEQDGKVHTKSVNRDRNPFHEAWLSVTGLFRFGSNSS